MVVFILQTARIYSDAFRKVIGWQSAVGLYCKFNRCAVYIERFKRMVAKGNLKYIVFVLLFLFLLNGCESLQEQESVLSSAEVQKTDVGEREACAVSNVELESTASEILQEMQTEENGLLEIYNDGAEISVSKECMIAQVSPQELLKGKLILYDRFRTDGFVFEWFISDYYDEDNSFLEDAVLVVSRENDEGNVQIIPVKAEGGWATWVSLENKFEYVDVNFDNLLDLLICTGHHGNQGLLTYYCFLQTKEGFGEAPTFTDISNPSIDVENQLILSQWRNSGASHSWAEYQCYDNTYVLKRELCEDAIWDSKQDLDIWVWTVNGEEIGRSDEMTEEEIWNLLYDENGEWGIAGERWRTLYNSGLTVDYSIYNEP